MTHYLTLRTRARTMRAEMSDAERALWFALRGKQVGGWRFLRQHVVENYILDFYCSRLRLAIEVDGGQHAQEHDEEYDQRRTKTLETKGIKVLRFWNNEVLTNLSGVIEAIMREGKARNPSPPSLQAGKEQSVLPSILKHQPSIQ